MDVKENTRRVFEEQMKRIKFITGKHTQVDLAALLGVKQSSISDAKKRGNIPPSWLVILMRCKHANPEWILTGNGPAFFSIPPGEPCYETGDEAAERQIAEEALRHVPSRMLADELVRRIALSRDGTY